MLTMALTALVVPAVVAALAGNRWWSASAIGLAYVAGHVAVARPSVPPSDVTDRIPWLALAASALALFEAARGPGGVVRGLGRGLLAALTIGLMLGPVVAADSLPRAVVAAVAAVAAIAWLNLEALAARPDGSDVLRTLVVSAGGAGVVLIASGSVVLGALGLALASGLAGGALAGRGKVPAGYVAVAAAVLSALVIEGYVYASVPAAPALLLAVAPAGAWATRFGPARRLGARARAALGMAAVSAPVAAAVALAVAASPTSEY